jgi:hypothetical protein
MPLDPHDLDVHLLDCIRRAVQPSREKPRGLYDVSAALDGLWLRFSACAAHEDAIAVLVADEQKLLETRSAQEKELFEFLVTGASALECAAFAAYRYASCLSQGYRFSIALENFKLSNTARAFKYAYPAAEITRVITDIDASREWALWKRARSILLRRAHPWRECSSVGPAQWLGEEFGYEFSANRRRWLAPTLHRILLGIESFVTAHPL